MAPKARPSEYFAAFAEENSLEDGWSPIKTSYLPRRPFIISIHIALKLGLSIPTGFTPYLITFPLTSSPTTLSGS